MKRTLIALMLLNFVGVSHGLAQNNQQSSFTNTVAEVLGNAYEMRDQEAIKTALARCAAVQVETSQNATNPEEELEIGLLFFIRLTVINLPSSIGEFGRETVEEARTEAIDLVESKREIYRQMIGDSIESSSDSIVRADARFCKEFGQFLSSVN